AHFGDEVVLHEPLRDQMALRESAPDLFRWVLHLPLKNERPRAFAVAHGLLYSLIHAVEQVFELVELLAPESSVDAKPVHDRTQGFGVGAVMCFPADPSIAYE